MVMLLASVVSFLFLPMSKVRFGEGVTELSMSPMTTAIYTRGVKTEQWFTGNLQTLDGQTKQLHGMSIALLTILLCFTCAVLLELVIVKRFSAKGASLSLLSVSLVLFVTTTVMSEIVTKRLVKKAIPLMEKKYGGALKEDRPFDVSRRWMSAIVSPVFVLLGLGVLLYKGKPGKKNYP